jgi:hypothetical protein
MIRLDSFTELLATPGRYATAFLDATRSKELGPQEVDTRWRDLRRSFEELGADEATLAAMQAAVGGHADVAGPHGQLLVGSGGTVLLDVALPDPPVQQIARLAPLPHLMPMVAQLGRQVPYVLVLVDRTGADVSVHGTGDDSSRSVQGDSTDVAAGVGGGRRRDEHHAVNLWEASTRDVAAAVESAVRRSGAQAVVVAGEPDARSALHEALGAPARDLVVQLEHGGRGAGGDREKLQSAIDEAVARVAAAQDQQVVDRYAEAAGRAAAGVGDVLAASGLADTVAALRQAQVETLLIVDDPSSTALAWVGPEPVHLALTAEELTELGVREPVQDRLDAALVRAAAGTDAAIVTLAPGQLELTHGLGATLRYPTAG